MASTFPGVIAFAFMASMIVVGVILRARIAWFRRNLMPASLIGGIVGFLLVTSGLSPFKPADFTVFAFHFFTLSFMSLVLTGAKPEARSSGVANGGMWLAIVWTMSLVLQSLVGWGAIHGYNLVAGTDLSVYLGIISTHGFTQGPGQALALGNIWEAEFAIENAVSIGVIYASMGFVAAFLIGVPLARRFVSRGQNSNSLASIDADFEVGLFSKPVSAGHQITHSANVDSLAMHIGILGIAYVLTDQYLNIVGPLAAEVNIGQANMGVIFSHNLFFFHGLIVCLVMRKVMDLMGYGKFIDDDTQRRITGSSVDLMVVATLMSIEFVLLAEYIVPILLVVVTVTLVTAGLCFGAGRHLNRLGPERSVAIFGCCCGSTGSGLLLLRMLDPDLSTPVALELAFFNVAILFIGFHVLTVMAPVLPAIDLMTVLAVYSGTFVIGLVLLALLKLRKQT